MNTSCTDDRRRNIQNVRPRSAVVSLVIAANAMFVRVHEEPRPRSLARSDVSIIPRVNPASEAISRSVKIISRVVFP